MEPRARIRTHLRRVGISAALAALLVPAAAGTADAAKHKHKPKLPVITSVKPMRAAIGDTLTIRGRNFKRGVNKNTVIFMRQGGRPVFVKAGKGTTKLLKVKLPASLSGGLQVKSGVPVATRFSLRVLASRFGKHFTSRSHSPLIAPQSAAGTPTTPPASAPDADCDGDGVTNRSDADDDNDLLPDTVEASLTLDPCNADTDGDSVPDGFEYRSALDLNDDEYQNKDTVPHNDILPYPGSRPYPNPLDPTDAHTDFDGDTLTLSEEYGLWQYTLAHEGAPYDLTRLTYSDGTQYSLYFRDDNGYRHPSQPASTYPKHQQFVSWATANGYLNVRFPDDGAPDGLWGDPVWNIPSGPHSIFDVNFNNADDTTSSDLDGNQWISDEERDEDADGLSNYDETHGRMEPAYWSGCYPQETKFPVSYAGTSPTVADSDGDGVLDGADDQDHDDVPNVMELSRIAATGGAYDDRKGPVKFDCKADTDNLPKPPAGNHPDAYGRVNPFNPCLPDIRSRTCPRSISLDATPPAPFDDSPAWWALN